MNTPKAEKRTYSDVETDSSPEYQEEKRREMAGKEFTDRSPIQEQFNSLAGLATKLQSIQKTMSDMCHKLVKLDSIEQLVSNTQATIENLTSSVDQVRVLSQTAMQEVTKCNQAIQLLSCKTKEIDILKEKLIQGECYSRRDNLIFEGIREQVHEDCESKIMDILVTTLKITDARTRIKFTRVHRLGGQMQNKTRPVIVKFHFFKDRQEVWSLRRKLKGTDIWMSEDFPVEIRNRRQVLQPIYQEALRSPDVRASLVADKLFLNKQMYTIETLHRLPENFKLQKTSLQVENSTVFFYNRSSPLSNFFPAPVNIDGVRYICSEQYYQCRKAETLGDEGAALKIMAADDPLTCKRLGDQATRTQETHKKWEAEKVKTMEKANLHKFQQNPHLKAVLLSTGDMLLAEASPKDTFWGIGVPIKDKRKADRKQWQGQNHLGEVLMKVRGHLKEN